jgi:hypothetical protein
MRAWLYLRLKNDAELNTLLDPDDDRDFEDQAFSSPSMTENDGPRPFLVYLVGNATDVAMAEEDADLVRQFWTIYIHDEPSDYTRIDTLVERVKEIFKNANGQGVGNYIMTTFHLETSRDFDDQTLGTIFRYVRFQSILSKEISP